MPPKTRLVTLMPVREMDRALKFYAKKLGAKVLYRGRGEMKDMWAAVRVADSEVWLVAPPERERRTLAYTTFLVRNIRSFVRGLQRKGVQFQRARPSPTAVKREGPIMFERFGASAFFKDSEGNLLMVWQNDPPM